jgi:hypothetical protein
MKPILKILLSSLFSIILNHGISQINSKTLVPYLLKNGTYGIVNYGTSNLINSEFYDEVEPLSNGFVKVRKDTKWGVVND